MSVEVGSFTASSTGNHTVFLNNSGLTPVYMEFEIGPRSSTNESDVRYGKGATDGTRQYAIAMFSGPVNKGTRETTSKCILHYLDSSGATLDLDGSFVSFSTGQFVVNITTANVNYTIRFRAFS